MKPDEELIRSFNLRSSTDQASNYTCQVTLKASDFSELDRKESQFSTTATAIDNGTQIGSSENHAKGGIWGFFEAIKAWCDKMWHMLINFFTGTTCSTRCWSFLKFVMYGLLLVAVLWLLHRKGLFDPLYDWWDDLFGPEAQERARRRHKRAHSNRHSHHGGPPPRRAQEAPRASPAATAVTTSSTCMMMTTRRRRSTSSSAGTAGTRRRPACSTGTGSTSTGATVARRLPWPRYCRRGRSSSGTMAAAWSTVIGGTTCDTYTDAGAV